MIFIKTVPGKMVYANIARIVRVYEKKIGINLDIIRQTIFL